jgi:hypothetical protein
MNTEQEEQQKIKEKLTTLQQVIKNYEGRLYTKAVKEELTRQVEAIGLPFSPLLRVEVSGNTKDSILCDVSPDAEVTPKIATAVAECLLEDVLDTLVAVDNGVPDELLNEACTKLVRFYDEWFKPITHELSNLRSLHASMDHITEHHNQVVSQLLGSLLRKY